MKWYEKNCAFDILCCRLLGRLWAGTATAFNSTADAQPRSFAKCLASPSVRLFQRRPHLPSTSYFTLPWFPPTWWERFRKTSTSELGHTCITASQPYTRQTRRSYGTTAPTLRDILSRAGVRRCCWQSLTPNGPTPFWRAATCTAKAAWLQAIIGKAMWMQDGWRPVQPLRVCMPTSVLNDSWGRPAGNTGVFKTADWISSRRGNKTEILYRQLLIIHFSRTRIKCVNVLTC